MPKQKDLKRLVRARMRKTGESYTAARRQLVASRGETAARAVADPAATAGMSDDAVRSRTGRTWRQWLTVLDRAGAAALPHREIARHLRDAHGLGPWWSQAVTVGYERLRGLRDVGQRRGGGYDVNKSKTLPVPVDVLYAAFGARRRALWLEAPVTVRTARRGKSMRLRWADDTPVNVHFWAKGPAKAQVQLQHGGLPTKATADHMRAFWTERLAALGELLRDRGGGRAQ